MLSEGKLEFGRKVVEIVRCGAIVAQESTHDATPRHHGYTIEA